MKTILFWILLLALPVDPYTDFADTVIAAIKTGNAKEISKNFQDKINLKILDKEDVYSRAQAESLLNDFFSKYKIKSFNASHSSASKGPNQFVVGQLETSNGKFRLSFLVKKVEEKYFVSQFRIENEN